MRHCGPLRERLSLRSGPLFGAATSGTPHLIEDFIKLAKGQYRVQWDKEADLRSRVHNIAEAINLGAPSSQASKRWRAPSM